ncbi:recombinase family protein [Geomonas propionica]|uniref:Recombinase family protein n=1 Tax=Geomonas propionica TaxID=2798582 RepID=A0ABS0YY07_9BACT|nr:recombinase family protein [Geomonas propionica]MBJ6802806.1 recombinase family protein [Geomonas propionica]
MAIIGYARVSTTDQKLDVQRDQLKAAGCERIFEEKESGAKQDRPELDRMLDFVREGDTVVVAKLDRIGRSTAHVLGLVEELNKKGIGFRALNNRDIDTTTASGRLVLSIFSAVAQFEREMMLERQADGIAKAKQAGKYLGRKPTAKAKSAEVMALLGQGKTKEAVATELGIGVASVYRIAKAHKAGK